MMQLLKPQQIKILLFVPNIICYLRIILLILTIIFAAHYPLLTFICYLTNSFILDGADGYAARKLKQESLFGRMFDYVLDRITIIALVLILTTFYPQYWSIFYIILAIESAAHFCQLYTTIFSGEKSHKQINFKKTSPLSLYYSHRIFMVFCCASHDMWLAMLYWYHFYPTPYLLWLSLIFLPGFILKTWIHLLKITYAINITLITPISDYDK